MRFFNTNGIETEKPIAGKFHIIENFNGDLIFSQNDLSYDIETICIKLRNQIAIKIFGDLNEFYRYLSTPIYPIVAQAGIDAELRISKEQFETLIAVINEKEVLNKLLYYYDIDTLIGTLQNAVLETKYIIGQFYRTLNVNSFLIREDLTVVENGIQYASGYIVTNITSLVNHLFINLYSQLDFTTKIIYEIENISTNFTIYPKLKSRDILFGDSKKTSFKEKPCSIFEMSEIIKTIICLRNEIVHNASIDSLPKVYQNIENKKIKEKFILLPDFNNGTIKTYKNRKRFFNDDNKLNELLPTIIFEFWTRLKQTLSEIK